MTKSKMWIVVLWCALYVLPVIAQQERGGQNREKLEQTKRVTTEVSLLTVKNLHTVGSRDELSTSRLIVQPSLNINKNWVAELEVGGEQQNIEPYQSNFINSSLGVTHSGILLGQDIQLINSAAIVLPTNEKMHQATSFNGALVVSPQIQIMTKVSKFKLNLLVGVDLGKNFHTYKRDKTAEANISHFATSQIVVSASRKSAKLSLSAKLNEGLTYDDRLREEFVLSQSLTISLKESVSIRLGHSNSAETLASDGKTSNVRMFDEKSSVIFAGLTIEN